MPIYISRGRFTSAAVKGMLAKPRCAAAAKASRTRVRPSWLRATGGRSPSAKGIAEGATACQPFGCSGGICTPLFHGTSVDALRPACGNWIAIGMLDQRLMLSSVRAIAASVASFQSPTSA